MHIHIHTDTHYGFTLINIYCTHKVNFTPMSSLFWFLLPGMELILYICILRIGAYTHKAIWSSDIHTDPHPQNISTYTLNLQTLKGTQSFQSLQVWRRPNLMRSLRTRGSSKPWASSIKNIFLVVLFESHKNWNFQVNSPGVTGVRSFLPIAKGLTPQL